MQVVCAGRWTGEDRSSRSPPLRPFLRADVGRQDHQRPRTWLLRVILIYPTGGGRILLVFFDPFRQFGKRQGSPALASRLHLRLKIYNVFHALKDLEDRNVRPNHQGDRSPGTYRLSLSLFEEGER